MEGAWLPSRVKRTMCQQIRAKRSRDNPRPTRTLGDSQTRKKDEFT